MYIDFYRREKKTENGTKIQNYFYYKNIGNFQLYPHMESVKKKKNSRRKCTINEMLTFFKIQGELRKSIKPEAVFTKTEINNK